jgi:hypothetical protein
MFSRLLYLKRQVSHASVSVKVIVYPNPSIHTKIYLLRTYGDPRIVPAIRGIVVLCVLHLTKQASLPLGKLKPGAVYYIIEAFI